MIIIIICYNAGCAQARAGAAVPAVPAARLAPARRIRRRLERPAPETHPPGQEGRL